MRNATKLTRDLKTNFFLFYTLLKIDIFLAKVTYRSLYVYVLVVFLFAIRHYYCSKVPHMYSEMVHIIFVACSVDRELSPGASSIKTTKQEK